MTKPLVLIFAYHFPPENAIGGARPFRFMKYLSRMGYSCRVFTAADQTGHDDPNTEYVPDPFFTRSRTSPSWQLERTFRKLFFPGEMGMQWSYHASRAARAYINAHPSNSVTVFSTFPPLGSHLAAWQLVRNEKLPWIGDFRDALAEEGTIHGNDFQEWLIRRLERKLMQIPDALIANTDASTARLQQKFPALREKVHTIWNGYDPGERIFPLPTPAGDCRVLSHTGELYGGRNAAPVLESIGRLIASGRILSRGVRVRLIGRADAGALPNQKFLARAREEGWLELVNELIPQPEALHIARSSHCLLLLQLRSPVHIPAKIFEYLQIGRPILAFVQPDSPSERLLSKCGVPYRCVYPGSPLEVIDNTVAEFFRLPSEPVAAGPWFEEQFNAENQTRQLGAIISSLHKEPVGRTFELPRSLVAARRVTLNQKMRISEETEKGSLNLVRPR
jgi:hypothetical protein